MTIASLLKESLQTTQKRLKGLKAEERLLWASQQFDSRFVATTSFGIQSAVLLHMLHSHEETSKISIIWVDTGYLPKETYQYADLLINQLNLNLIVVQSELSPGRMEAIYGKLWETNQSEDLEKYHFIRKVQPLEKALEQLQVECWASGVRGNQTNHRSSMTCLDEIRDRFSIRPLLDWSKKDIYYYMQEHKLPQHPLFEKGYSTVGDWHSSAPDGTEVSGRDTRFGGIKEECGIHLPGYLGDGI